MSKINYKSYLYDDFKELTSNFQKKYDVEMRLNNRNRAFIIFKDESSLLKSLIYKTNTPEDITNKVIVMLYKKNNKPFLESDFTDLFNLNIYKKQGEFTSFSYFFIHTLIDDIKINKYKVILFTLLNIFLFSTSNKELLLDINKIFLDLSGLILSAYFIFIGFFYSDSKKCLESYSNGSFEKRHRIDKYCLLIISWIIVINLFSISFLSSDLNFLFLFLEKCNISLNLNVFSKVMISSIIVYISTLFFVIVFDTVNNYYFEDIKNRYFIDSISEIK